MSYLSDHENDPNCYCMDGFTCRHCSKKAYEKAVEEEEKDPTIYTFTMCIKSDIPESNKAHGTYAYYGSSVVTRTCTIKKLNAELNDFMSSGGKVVSIERVVAKKICPECNSKVTYNFYNFEHDCCSDCLELRSEAFTEKIKGKINTILLTKAILHHEQV